MSELAALLDKWQGEQIDFLARFVNQDSGTDDRDDVNKAGDLLVEALDSLHFDVTRLPQDRFGDHIVGVKPGSGPKRILFVGHYDTVFSSGTARERPFRIVDGRAYGPGVYDMKGGLTGLLFALRAHREADTKAFAETTITVIFNSDEERFSPTSKALIQAEARQAHSVGILEPARPGGEYVLARKGAGTFYLEVEGKASHAGLQPEMGASAIWDLAQKVADLSALTDLQAGMTVNVGVIRGGERPNVVADRASAEIDLRVWTPEDGDRMMARMRAIAEEVRVPGTRARFRGEIHFPPWPPGLPGTTRLLQIMEKAGHEIGLEVRAIKTGGGSDGNHACHVAPTIDGLGPQGSRAHSDEEYILVPTLLERSKMVAFFLDHWAAEFAIA
jgi:glutamate carboxypeptidase